MKHIIRAPLVFFKIFYQSIYLAMGQIWANKMRSALTTLGIVIGVASVTAVIAALTGLKTEVLGEMESVGTSTIYISPRRPDTGPLRHASYWTIRFLPEHFEGLLEHCPSIECFSRIAQIGGRTVRYGEKSIENVSITAVEPDYHKIDNRPIELGRPLSYIDNEQVRQVCLVDIKLRDDLHLDMDCIGETILIGYHKFVIVGVIEYQPDMMNMNMGSYEILIPFKTAYKLDNPTFSVRAASKSPEIMDEAQREIKFFLRRTRQIEPTEPDTFSIDSIQRYITMFTTIAAMVTFVAGGIVSISLLVGGIGIMNIMLVSVSERTREIGLRKAVGAKKSAILTQFLIESVVLCCLGGLIGIICGQLMVMLIDAVLQAVKDVKVLDNAFIPLWAIALSFGFASSVGIFFGIFPAMKAANLDPIEALRHE